MSRLQIERDIELLLSDDGRTMMSKYHNAADCWDLIEGLVGRLRAAAQAQTQPNEPFAWLDVARRIADSGVMDDLPSDYATSHKKQKVVE
jgi:hypothetical protein